MDCSSSGSSVHGIFQARILELGFRFLLQGIRQTQHLLCLLHCRLILCLLSPMPQQVDTSNNIPLWGSQADSRYRSVCLKKTVFVQTQWEGEKKSIMHWLLKVYENW